jgi:hypothetical protein
VQEIQPRVEKLANEELAVALDRARLRAQAELSALVEQLDTREELINQVVAVIQNRLSPPPPINQDEFEANA